MPEIKSPDLQVNQSVEAKAPDATLIITVDPAKPLVPGTYVFQLQVFDDANNASLPTTVKLLVIDDQAPNARIDAPETVPFGRSFTLSGKPSFDVGGTIVKYAWTLVRAP
jgi:hypothetical protein